MAEKYVIPPTAQEVWDSQDRLDEELGNALDYALLVATERFGSRASAIDMLFGWFEGQREIDGSTAGSKKPISASLRWKVWARDDFRCKHCGNREFLAVDHIYPEFLGGEASEENLQTLCRSCNSRKGTRTP